MSKGKLSPIHETETVISPNELDTNEYDEFELDDLFSELKKANQSSNITIDTITDEDEFAKIKKSLQKLPKIQENGASLSTKQTSTKKSNTININDPIRITKKKARDDKNTAGAKWFDMPKGELTESVKRDMKIIQQRAALDPKRHYKKDKWKTPEYFQIGTIVEGSHEFFSSRINKKERHQTILESVMNDEDTKHYFKRKYDEIQTKKTSGKKAHYKKVKEARRKF